MKRLTTVLMCLFVATNTHAQQAKAQLLFEEAEVLYGKYTAMDCTKNPQGCAELLTQIAQKLDGAEKIVGEKPKIVFLTALTLYNTYELFDYSNLYHPEHGEHLFDLADGARKYAKRYLELKQNDDVDDRYRDMKKIADELQKYPKDKAAWQQAKERKEADERVAAEKEKIKTEKLEAYYREIAPKIDSWEWKDGLKTGANYDELKKNNPELFIHMRENKGRGYIDKRSYKVRNKLTTPYIWSVNTDYPNKIVEGYQIDLCEKKEEYEKIKKDLLQYCNMDSFTEEKTFDYDQYHIVDSPYSDYAVYFKIYENSPIFLVYLWKIKKDRYTKLPWQR